MKGALQNRNYQAVSLLLISVLVYRLSLLEVALGLSAASAQYVLLFPVLLAFTLFRYKNFRIPVFAIVCTVIASVFMAVANYNIRVKTEAGANIIFSPFKADDSQVLSIKFQDLLKKDFSKFENDINIINYPNPVEGTKTADQIFKSYPTNSLLMAGSERWFRLYFSERKSTYFASELIENELKLKVLHRIKSIGFSQALSDASRSFILLLGRAYESLAKDDLNQAEILLLDASSIQARWTSPAHRAYPLWLAGTLKLENLDPQNTDSKKIICALEYFNLARKKIHNRDNPELLAAILNNRGVAHYLAYLYFGKKNYG